MIFKYTNKRLHQLMANIQTQSNAQISPNNNKNSIPIKNHFIVLPYIDSITNKVKEKIKGSNIQLGLRNLQKLNKFVKVHKDINNKENCNNVIYKIYCKDCDASYVEQTKRQLCTRLQEHKANIKLDCSKHSVISEHIKNFNHSFDWAGVEILDTEHKYHKRIISEMIHIREQKNGINLQTDSESLDDKYTVILSELAKLH